MTAQVQLLRRQVFLHDEYYQVMQTHFRASASFWKNNSPEADSPEQAQALAAASVAGDGFKLLTLRYTAGEPIEFLRAELGSVIEAYERYQQALAEYEGVPNMAPLGLDQLGDYERCMQLIGLCYLLHRRDLLPRLSSMIDPGYRGEDTLYEDLMSYTEVGRVDLDEWYHDEPYTPLIRAIYEDDKNEAAALLNEYVESWYPAFKYVPWHDGHLRINGTDGDYFGYWAFEAGAVAYLCNIDDSAVTHMVYPKDLVDWARSHAHLSGTTAQERQLNRLRCEAGQSCLKDGEWETPAQTNSRRRFKQGEIMPSLDTDYGQTIWQWVGA